MKNIQEKQKQKVSFSSVLKEAVQISWSLYKIIIPVSIITKILNDLGAIKQLGQWLSPVMEIVGLPGDMGIVWVTAMVTNLYAGMIVFSGLAPTIELSVAQVTVLSTLMLVAHGLPVELRIAQRSGPRFRPMLVLRVVGAFSLGWILHKLYTVGGLLQSPNITIWRPQLTDPSWSWWILDEGKKMVMIFIIITVLLIVLKLLQYFGGTEILRKLLAPLFSLLGMSKDVVTIIVVSMTLGLSYGGGLIIHESKSGRIKTRDIFLALALMGLCHSVVEDTLLMMLIGGHLSGILFARILFSFVVIFLLAKVVHLIGDNNFNRFLFRPDKSEQKES